MRICLSHQTALSYWLRVPNLRARGSRLSRASSIPARVPDDATARRLREALGSRLPEHVDRLDVLVSTEAGRHQTKTVRAHLCTTSLPAGSFVFEEAMGIGFHLSSPELTFLQLAGELEIDHLVYVGFALCSEFRLDEWEPGGCVRREGSDAPLTSVARIRSFLERVPRGTRGRARALSALEHVRDGARSPAEGGIAMVVGMPLRYGGHHLGEIVMNPRIRVYDGVDVRGEARWVTRIPDVLVSARDRRGRLRRVGIDYDALSTHGSAERAADDVERRNLMAPTDDFTHITLGTDDVGNYISFRREIDRIRRALGQRPRPRIVGNRESLRNRRLESTTLSRQFELWDRVLGSSRPRL